MGAVRTVSGLAAALAWACMVPSQALANDFDVFQEARGAYDAGDYRLATQRFTGLVGGDVPRLQNQSLILESLKYLAASQLFLGDAAGSHVTFQRLLAREPAYVLDPMAFPQEVQRAFAKAQAEARQAAIARREQAAQQALSERRAADRAEAKEQARLQALIELAKTERVEIRRSRWAALVPFGLGQFQNGNDGLGAVLAVSEGLLAATSVVTYALHQDLEGQIPTDAERSEAIFTERGYRYANQISLGLFAAVAVAGLIEAQLSFQPSVLVERSRPLPASTATPAAPRLSVTGNGFRVAF